MWLLAKQHFASQTILCFNWRGESNPCFVQRVPDGDTRVTTAEMSKSPYYMSISLLFVELIPVITKPFWSWCFTFPEVVPGLIKVLAQSYPGLFTQKQILLCKMELIFPRQLIVVTFFFPWIKIWGRFHFDTPKGLLLDCVWIIPAHRRENSSHVSAWVR